MCGKEKWSRSQVSSCATSVERRKPDCIESGKTKRLFASIRPLYVANAISRAARSSIQRNVFEGHQSNITNIHRNVLLLQVGITRCGIERIKSRVR